MPFIQYVDKKLSAKSLVVIDQANRILEEYAIQGYDLTLRQLYYQFVARGLLENHQKNYKRLGSIIDNARLVGLIDWDRIEDRTRGTQKRSSWDKPGDILYSAASSYHIDWWKNQMYRPEVWVEKEALVGIFAQVCSEWDIPFLACRGYTSQSEMWRSAMRMNRSIGRRQRPIILHFGDMILLVLI